jgi:maltose O-acetyltransferase
VSSLQTEEDDEDLGLLGRFAKAVHLEVVNFHPVQKAVSLASRAIPLQVGNRLRASALRVYGVEVGAGTIVYGPPEMASAEEEGFAKMTIGKDCVIHIGCLFELGDTVTIGDRVTIGNGVMVITTTHQLGPRTHRAGTRIRHPVVIQDGAWIGARSVILPGVTVGAGAVVDAGSTVNKSVEPNTRVRGSPARVVEELSP